MKCVFHSADLDGHCSGAIVKNRHPDCEMIPINYGQDFPWTDLVFGETVYMVDFSLQPFEDMIRLNNEVNLIWIDHHISAINDAKLYNFSPAGLRSIDKAACQLTWEYLYPTSQMPLSVFLLGQYDIWKHEHKLTLPFQYGMRLKNTLPLDDNMLVWRTVFGNNDFVFDIAKIGKSIVEYDAEMNKKFCKLYAFETSLFFNNSEYKVICINKGLTNSRAFDSVWDPITYDLMATFCRMQNKQWTVSLYTTKDDVDCSVIAKSFGGGGHRAASGFQCQELPFAI